MAEQPSVFQAEQIQFSQPPAVTCAPAPDHVGDPTLNLLQFINVFFVQREFQTQCGIPAVI